MGELPPGLARAWGDELVADYEERAAILEYDAHLSREEAEQRAQALTSRTHHARQEALAEALRRRPAAEVQEEAAARRGEVERSNTEFAERSKVLWPKGKSRRKGKSGRRRAADYKPE
jgi:hypothetical protein